MKRITTAVCLTGALALSAATAMAVPPSGTPGAGHGNAQNNPGASHRNSTPGPNAPAGVKARAYGRDCQGESHRHVAGQKGTPFSQCVTAMARLATHQTNNPTTACRGESHRHVAGQKGTPFSQCVSAAARLHRSQHQHSTTQGP